MDGTVLQYHYRRDKTTLVVKNEQAEAHKTTGATNRDYKEKRKLQNTHQTSRRLPSV
jgi:hypothetical protein